jgi:hypothetical protein
MAEYLDAATALTMKAFECPACRHVGSPGQFVHFGEAGDGPPLFGCDRCGAPFVVVAGSFVAGTRSVGVEQLVAHAAALDPWGEHVLVVQQWIERVADDPPRPDLTGRAYDRF